MDMAVHTAPLLPRLPCTPLCYPDSLQRPRYRGSLTPSYVPRITAVYVPPHVYRVYCASLAVSTVHSLVLPRLLATPQPSQVASGSSKVEVKAAKLAIAEGFKKTDEEVLRACAAQNWVDGACAACAWVVGETVLVANIGDVKCVLARISDKVRYTHVANIGDVNVLARISDKEGTKGQLRAITLSKDHLPIYPQERARIQKSGGFVSKDGRLNGRMQVSRSFGDIALKKSGCISQPDITVFGLTERDKFMLLGCDGFWGVFDAEGAVEEAAKLLEDPSRDDKAVTNRLLNMAVRERGCRDNATVLLLRFSQKT
eukprot:gene6613-3266_t